MQPDTSKWVRKVTSIEELISELLPKDKEEKTGRYRNSVLFRGLPNSNYSLMTSLYRNCDSCSLELENSIIRNFAKYAVSENPAISKSVWEKLFIGQHHGLPTRILDWTWSPLMGLHFATGAENPDDLGKNDVALWAVDFEGVHKTLPEKYASRLKKDEAHAFTVDMINDLAPTLADYDKDMGNSSMVLVEPPSIDPRIVNQFSFFSIIPHDIIYFEDFLALHPEIYAVKYIIPKDLVWQLRDYLDIMNINERTVYPGLDGISKWLKRYYYSKK